VNFAAVISGSVVAASSTYAFTLARRLRQLGPHLVHTNSLKSAVYGVLAGRLAGIPVICHIRDRVDSDSLPKWTASAVRLLIDNLSSGVVANSANTMEALRLDRSRGSRWVVSSAINFDALVISAKRRQPSPGLFRVAMVGRLAPWKGQDVFIRAFAEAFPDAGPANAVIVGSALFGENAYEARLKALIADLGVGDRIEMIGFSNNIESILQQVDCLVHASVLPEPFGQVVAEGMAAGLPVIASDAGGPQELISDGVSGLLYPTGDVTALASALRRLQSDPILAARLGRAASQAVSDLTPAAVASKMMDVYMSVRSKIAPASGSYDRDGGHR